MDETISVSDAKAKLAALLKRIEQGAEVVITRRGVPIARVSPIRSDAVKRRAGCWGWEPGSYDPAIFAPMTDEEIAREGWM